MLFYKILLLVFIIQNTKGSNVTFGVSVLNNIPTFSSINESIALGEETLLSSLNETHSSATSQRQQETLDIAPSPSLFQKKKYKRKRKQASSNDNDGDARKYDDLIKAEFHPFSEHHALSKSTEINRSTVARLHNQALGGSIDSCYFLGLIYLYGLNDMTPNPKKAVLWFEKAANEGHVEGQCALGLILHHGLGDVEQDREVAMYWFYMASMDKSKNTRAFWLFGRSLYEGLSLEDVGVEPETVTSSLGLSMKDYIKAGQNSNFFLAAHLFHDAKDVHEAMHYLALMFEYGLVPDTFGSNQKSKNQQNIMTRFERAAALYRAAARLGSTESLYNLGLMHTYGRGLPLSYAKAKILFEQAIKQEHSSSMRYMARLAVNGWGQNEEIPNLEEAIHWLEQCIQHGHDEKVEQLCRKELEEVEGYVNAAESFHAMTMENL